MTPEMHAFEHSLGLFAVLIGLAVADVANSFHRLMRSRFPVTWDPLTLLAAFYALCMAVGMWFVFPGAALPRGRAVAGVTGPALQPVPDQLSAVAAAARHRDSRCGGRHRAH